MQPVLLLVFALYVYGCADIQTEVKTGELDPMSHSEHFKDISVPGLQSAIVRGELNSEEITRYFLAQIAHRNDTLHAVIAVNPEALNEARAQDEARVRNTGGKIQLKLLEGIPVLLKDNIESRENATTAGSLALQKNFTGRDAPLVQRLRQQGAIILGKANLSEWANFRSERSSSGWSAVAGQTRNPNDITRSPCGSSSGSGVAVAAGLVPLAVGTETDGSIVCPSSVNGVVGIKPTLGLIPTQGIVPISRSQDTAGPMAGNVEDAARLLAALLTRVPPPRELPRGLQQELPQHPSRELLEQSAALSRQLAQLQAADLAGKRFGVLRSAAGFHEGVDALFDHAIARLESQGAVIVDKLELKPYADFHKDAYTVLLYEFKAGLNSYLAALPNDLSQLSLQRLIEFNEAHRNDEMAYFGQEIFVKAEAKGDLSQSEYREALQRVQRASREEGLDALFDEHHLDALIAPTTSAAWKIDRVNGDHYLGGFSSYPAIAGYPHITVPMGRLHGLPVGLSFTGPAFSEGDLAALAQAFERIR